MKSIIPWKNLTFLLYLIPCFLKAGDSVGNGGNVLVCPQISTYSLLDFYEARSLRNIEITQGSSLWTLNQNIEHILKRLSTKLPLKAERYKKQYSQFFKDAQFLQNASLGTIDDSDQVFIPQDCYIEQVAIRLHQRLPGEALYLIQGDLWSQLSTQDQAGLILHEFIYADTKHPTSKRARYFNSILWSDKWDQYSTEEIKKLVKNLGIYEN